MPPCRLLAASVRELLKRVAPWQKRAVFYSELLISQCFSLYGAKQLMIVKERNSKAYQSTRVYIITNGITGSGLFTNGTDLQELVSVLSVTLSPVALLFENRDIQL